MLNFGQKGRGAMGEGGNTVHVIFLYTNGIVTSM
jgi:hypothetical protein